MVMDRDGRDHDIRHGERFPLLRVLTLETTSELCDGIRNGKKPQAAEQRCGLLFFSGTEAGVNLGDVYRTAGECVPLLREKDQ